MSIGYTHFSPEAIYEPKGNRMANGLHLLKSLCERLARPVQQGKPLGVYLPDRIWRRQSALFMCLYDPGYDERP